MKIKQISREIKDGKKFKIIMLPQKELQPIVFIVLLPLAYVIL